MVAKPDLAGRMRGYVLRLDAHSPVRSGEQQVIGEQPVQRDDIGSELRKTQFTFVRHDLGVGLADQDAGVIQRRKVNSGIAAESSTPRRRTSQRGSRSFTRTPRIRDAGRTPLS